jgi:hypothetical protein
MIMQLFGTGFHLDLGRLRMSVAISIDDRQDDGQSAGSAS